jgi:RNA polymerase sigma-70 factor (ECF subfamily)
VNRETEKDLVSRCQRGESSAFRTLVEAYHGAVYNIAMKIVRDSEEARDISQTVFLKVFQNLDRFDPQYRLFSWVYRIALNEALNVQSARARLEPLRHEVAGTSGPEDEVSTQQVGNGVLKALDALTPEHRAVIVLKHFEGCSYQDISEILELPEKTVKSRLFEARQALRRRLEEYGLTA